MAAITWIAFFASANFVISVAKPLDVDKGVQNEIVDSTSMTKENTFFDACKICPSGLLACFSKTGLRLSPENGETSHRLLNITTKNIKVKKYKIQIQMGDSCLTTYFQILRDYV